jgi:ribosomal protein S14
MSMRNVDIARALYWLAMEIIDSAHSVSCPNCKANPGVVCELGICKERVRKGASLLV